MAILEVLDLDKSFGALKATDGFCLTVEPGEIHALIGPNGAGKTSIIEQVYGNLRPDGGVVLLKGRDITRLKPHQRVRQGVGRSFQISTVLMDFTVEENAMVAEAARLGAAFGMLAPAFSDPELREGAAAILGRVGLGGRAGVLVRDLSHGERRLLELGLALSADPDLLLLDEPMAGSGPEESLHMGNIIAGYKGRCAMLLIEHDMDAVFRLADRITVLVEGRVVATGGPDEISRHPGVREAYLGEAT